MLLLLKIFLQPCGSIVKSHLSALIILSLTVHLYHINSPSSDIYYYYSMLILVPYTFITPVTSCFPLYCPGNVPNSLFNSSAWIFREPCPPLQPRNA